MTGARAAVSRRRLTYVWAAWLVALAALTMALLLVRTRLDKAHVALAFLLTVLGASASGGRTLGLTIAGSAFLLFNYLFLEPYHTLVIADPLDWLVLVAFLVTSIVAAQLLYRATATAEAATRRAEEVDRLASLGAETLNAPGATEALDAIATVIRSATEVDSCAVYRRLPDGAVRCVAVAHRDAGAGAAERLRDVPAPWPNAGELAPAGGLVGWLGLGGEGAVELSDGTVRLLQPPGGRSRAPSTPPLTAHDAYIALRQSLDAIAIERPSGVAVVRALLIPLIVRDVTVGVLRIASRGAMRLTAEQSALLVALAYYAALGVERLRLVETAEQAESERRLEALRGALLTAVSHDLRTPLTTIKAIAHELANGGDRAGAVTIEAEADRLDRMVADLLDLSRIQAGAVQPSIAVNTVDELLDAALRGAAGRLRGRTAEVDVAAGQLLVGRFDFSHTLRIVVNLIENAVKYSPDGAPIGVRAWQADGRLRIAVLDRGAGVAEAERERIFDPFYRPRDTSPDVGGTGLGLSIARGLAEAQDGTLRHEPRAGGGSAFVLELPAAADPTADA